MAFLYTGDRLPPDAMATIRRNLDWPMVVFASNRDRFDRLGGKGGSLAGVITEAMYVKPKLTKPAVAVLFLRDLSRQDWASFSRSFVQQRFMLELANNTNFRNEVRTKLAA
jgi:hypothetical protein